MFNPAHWVDPSGFFVLIAVMVVTLVGLFLKLAASARWDDWLDERLGRGSIRDWWVLRRNGDAGGG